MKRLYCLAMLGVALGSASAAEAGSSLFERSYYSHAPAKPVVVGHRAPTGVMFTRPQGMAASGGIHWQRSQIRVGGQVVDQLNYWDSWIQVQGKY